MSKFTFRINDSGVPTFSEEEGEGIVVSEEEGEGIIVIFILYCMDPDIQAKPKNYNKMH